MNKDIQKIQTELLYRLEEFVIYISYETGVSWGTKEAGKKLCASITKMRNVLLSEDKSPNIKT